MLTPYRVLLALHIVAIISWMAGILYLFRLFVYHAEENEAVVKSRFQIMEKRLLKFITVPAMLVSIAAGVTMLGVNPSLLSEKWMHAKLFFVFCLIGMTLYAGSLRHRFERGDIPLSGKMLRFLNEVPTLLMIVIVALVILRPF